MTHPLTVIVAPPPTPNGDLHVGHLSGPYFGADVLRRYLALRGRASVAALSVDLNQSYVVTTAERLGLDAYSLASESHSSVQETLIRAGIDFDIVGMPDGSYADYVSKWFAKLYEAGVIERHRRWIPFDVKRDRFMFESYGSGFCPTCCAGTKANICEACGHPNEAVSLLGLYPTGGQIGDPVELREIEEYFIDLEAVREPLLSHLMDVIPERRPNLSRLIDELFAKRLPKFPITFPSGWGIPAPFPGASGLVLNVWAEMVPGHYYWIDQACSGLSAVAPREADPPIRYVQYLGFDNSFFYVLAHLGIALAARAHDIEHIIPAAFITNEFYLLDNFKFSTSQGHLIWGRDLLEEASADDVRFYLAWSNPEYNQANFSREDMDRVLDKKFRQPIARICAMLAEKPGPISTSLYSQTLLRRFETAYDERRQSLRLVAQTVSNGLDLIEANVAGGTDMAIVRGIAEAVACGLSPLASVAADRIWRSVGRSGPVRWPSEADSTTDNLPHGIAGQSAQSYPRESEPRLVGAELP